MQILPNGKTQWIDQNGAPLANGSVYFYAPGTTNPLPTYQDSAGTIANTNPIQLDSRGQAIVWGNATYRQVVQDANGVTVWDQVVTASASVAALAGSGGASLIGLADGSTLASTFLSNLSRVVDSIAALRALKCSFYTRALVTGYYSAGDGGGGSYWYDPSDTSSADNGGTIIVASDGGRWKLQQVGLVNVKQFGAKGNGSADDTAALAAAQAFASAQTVVGGGSSIPWRVEFPAGIYCYTISPNWAVNGAKFVARGHVVLRYKGTGNAVILDAGSTTGAFVQDCTFGEQSNPFIIEAPASAGHGIFARGLNTGSVVSAVVRGAGTSSAGLLTNACVITTFNVQVAPYTSGWYSDGSGVAKPQFGMILNQRNTGEQTSYCTFINPQAAACQYGYYLDYTLGNIFIGGDGEYNTSTGMVLTANAVNNKIFGMDFEQNTSVDVSCAGSYNEFICDTGSGSVTGGFRFVSGSVGNRLKGGVHDQIAVDAGTGNYIGECVYGRSLSGNLQIVDNGTKTAYGRNWQAQQSKWTFGPSVTNSVTVGASPFTYTNNTGMPQQVFITGGTVSTLAYFRASLQLGTLPTNSSIVLSSGDSLSVTYTVAPTITTASLQ